MTPLLTQPPILQTAEDSLQAALGRINRAVDAMLSCEESMAALQSRGLEHALAIGRELNLARDLRPQEESWDDWRKANLPHKRSLRQYSSYARVADQWHALAPLVESGEISSIREALRFLARTEHGEEAAPAIAPPNKIPDREITGSVSSNASGNLPVRSSIVAQTSQAEESSQEEVATQTEPLSARISPRPAQEPHPVQPIQPVRRDETEELLVKVKILEAENQRLQREGDELKVKVMRLEDELAKTKREAREAKANLEGVINDAVAEGVSARGELAQTRLALEEVRAEVAVLREEAKGKVPAPADMLHGIRIPDSPRKIEDAQSIAEHYQRVVDPGETIGRGIQVIRQRLLTHTAEQMMRAADGYADFCNLKGKVKREAVGRFYSLGDGSFADFENWQPSSEPARGLQPPTPTARAASSAKPTRAEMIAKHAKDLL